MCIAGSFLAFVVVECYHHCSISISFILEQWLHVEVLCHTTRMVYVCVGRVSCQEHRVGIGRSRPSTPSYQGAPDVMPIRAAPYAGLFPSRPSTPRLLMVLYTERRHVYIHSYVRVSGTWVRLLESSFFAGVRLTRGLPELRR